MFANLRNSDIVLAYGIPESPLDITGVRQYFRDRFEIVYWKEEEELVTMLLHPGPYAKYTFADFQAMGDTGISLMELRPDTFVHVEIDGIYFKAGDLKLRVGDGKGLPYDPIAAKNGIVLE